MLPSPNAPAGDDGPLDGWCCAHGWTVLVYHGWMMLVCPWTAGDGVPMDTSLQKLGQAAVGGKPRSMVCCPALPLTFKPMQCHQMLLA